jgi:hypothetical protein
MIDEEKNKQSKQIERAVICDSLKEKLAAMRDQANTVLQGVATITKSDVVNLILEGHASQLSPTEIENLKERHLDQVKFAFWVAKRLKEAQAAGESLTIQDILAASHSVMATPTTRIRRPRKKKDAPDSSNRDVSEAHS